VTGNTAASGGGIYNVRKGTLIGIVILSGTRVKGNTGGDIVGV
jgi:predicted outer membrane repeat protein